MWVINCQNGINEQCRFQNEMAKILKEEIEEFEKDIEKQELIYRELMEEADQWLYEDMELAEAITIDLLLENNDIFCPVCQKFSLLREDDSVVARPCGLRWVTCILI